MTPAISSFGLRSQKYIVQLNSCFNDENIDQIEILIKDLLTVWVEGRHIYICGNDGSAKRVLIIALALLAQGQCYPGLRVEALPANSGLITC